MRKISILVLLLIFLTGCTTIKPNDGVVVLKEPKKILKIDLDTGGKVLPKSKADGSLDVKVKLQSDNQTFKSYGTIKVQGSSTARWPKKNWTINFYEDENHEVPIKVQIGDSIPVDKWVTKAEWVDPSMYRNGVSFGLWESMVQSRENEPMFEVHNSNSENFLENAQGFPFTYPSVVNVDGEHYGLAIFMMGHELDNFNIDKNNPEHVYMEFDARGGYTKIKTWDKFTSDGIGEWIDGYYPDNDEFTQEMKESIDALGSLINGTQDNFNAEFDKRLDKTNIIDMYLFLEMIYDYDAVAQDLEMVTYDLEKWYFLPWDKDTTFGMAWDESGIDKSYVDKILISVDKERDTQKPWYKTYHAFTDDIENRYTQLRDDDVFTTSNLERLINRYDEAFNPKLRNKEIERWEDRP
ncbi:MAG TPA: CotH kinase family protein, partial [Erysipelothrix sp.]|nr:CotH kinase family protein [Erysipelothrix sp.]